jgi:small GTP-binding protein
LPNPTALLNDRENELRSRARGALEDLRAELAAFGASKADLDTLRQAARDLDDLFLLVIVGEFNAGKSALINALLGAPLLEEGVTPTTASVQIIRHGASTSQRWLSEDLLEREYDTPLLREVAIVDTPGTNAILKRHQQLTEQFVPRSDLVLFVTSADRPFTESERAFMESVRGWGKKVVLVINKIDLMRDEAERRQVVGFVEENVQSLLGFRPRVFPVSARRAAESAMADSAGSGQPDADFSQLQRFIAETLTAENRVRLKISSPLGVASRILEEYYRVAEERLALLAEDAKAGESMESQLDYYREDMRAQFPPRLHEVENLVYDLSQRADQFFDETFRLARVFDLVNADKIKGDFDRVVLGNTSEKIDASVDGIARWMVGRETQLWQGVAEELARRRKASEGGAMPSGIGGEFEESRRELIQNVARTARGVVAGFDRESEARKLGDAMREAVAHTALAEVSALGLGTLVTVLIGTAAADVSGILAGTLIAGLGLYIIPARKQRVQKQFRQRTDELRLTLRDALAKQLKVELDSSLERTETAIAPYLRFVRSEQGKLSAFHDTLGKLGDDIGALRRQVGAPHIDE